MFRALVVDDEEPARAMLCSMLRQRNDVEVVGEAGDGGEAVELIERLAPDLVFLDVQMSEMDGFGVIEKIGPAKMPRTIFVTAFDQYALRAFEVQALDYLLKPYDTSRLNRAIDRARATQPAAAVAELTRVLAILRARREFPDRIPIRLEGRTRLIDVMTIDWIEAADKQLRFHVGRTCLETRGALTAIEEQLNPRVFARVHRSIIVNLRRLVEIQPWFHGEYVLVLQDGSKLHSGRSYRAQIGNLLAGWSGRAR
jgi:two-component system LytT family response regulator